MPWGEYPYFGDAEPFALGLDAPTGYPRYYYYDQVAPLGVTPVEPALLSGWATAPLLVDSSLTTGYSLATGVSALPVGMIGAAADFGVNMRLSQVQVVYKAGFSGAASGRTMTYVLSTGVDDGSGGIIWTQRSTGSLTIEETIPPATARTLSLNFTAINCRYWKLVALINGASGVANLVEVLGNQSTICDPPAKVLNVRGLGVCEGAQVTIRWDPAATATGYKIRITNPQGSSAINTVGNVTEFVAAPATIGLALTFQVLGINGCGDGPYSDPLTLTPCSIVPPPTPQPPLAPTNLRGSGICEGAQNTLRWDASATAHRYEVRVNAGTPLNVGNVLVWIHTPATVGTSYTYEVRAWNPDGYSGWSTPVTVATCSPPPPPPPSTAFAINAYGHCTGPVAILWISPTTGGETYEIWRRSQSFPGDGELLYSGIMPTQSNPFRDEPIPLGEPVSYRARAKNAGGYTDWTGWVHLTPCIEDGCGCDSHYVLVGRCGDCHCCCGESCSCGPDGGCGDVNCAETVVVSTSSDTSGAVGGTVTIGNGVPQEEGGHGH